MDKIKLTESDINKVLAWRDEHKDLVRLAPAPFAAIEIVAPNGVSLKVFRKEDTLTLHVFCLKKKLGKIEFRIDGMICRLVKSSPGLDHELRQSALTVYASLMAYMTYAQKEVNATPRATAIHVARGTARKKSYTYVLKRTSASRGIGHHASPQGVFSVRGHYRRYKSGKTIWIAEYKKGTGEKKAKTYKIGVKDRDA